MRAPALLAAALSLAAAPALADDSVRCWTRATMSLRLISDDHHVVLAEAPFRVTE